MDLGHRTPDARHLTSPLPSPLACPRHCARVSAGPLATLQAHFQAGSATASERPMQTACSDFRPALQRMAKHAGDTHASNAPIQRRSQGRGGGSGRPQIQTGLALTLVHCSQVALRASPSSRCLSRAHTEQLAGAEYPLVPAVVARQGVVPQVQVPLACAPSQLHTLHFNSQLCRHVTACSQEGQCGDGGHRGLSTLEGPRAY